MSSRVVMGQSEPALSPKPISAGILNASPEQELALGHELTSVWTNIYLPGYLHVSPSLVRGYVLPESYKSAQPTRSKYSMSSNDYGPAHSYDIDDAAEFASCWTRLKDPATRNFAIQFDDAHAHCATDLTEEGVLNFLRNEKGSQNVRWLNFWGSEEQTDEIKQVASHFELSPRLTTLLCMRTSGKQQSTEPLASPKNNISSHKATLAPSRLPATDLEKALSAQTSGAAAPVSANPQKSGVSSFGDIVDDLWHFCSVDWGRRYLYVGLNALFTIPGVEHQQTSSKPAGQRIWISLVLCDDGTVISVFENPPSSSIAYREAVGVIRRNVLNIFSQLSKLHMDNDHYNALMKVNVRPRQRLPPSDNGLGAARSESASLLFYYVFDDWVTTYGLIARKEHPYRHKLEELRTQMFESAEVNLIRSLHLVGRRLTILKLMYQSYDLIVSRILQRQRFLKNTATPLVSQIPFGIDDDECFNISRGIEDSIPTGEDRVTNVRLTSSAVFRFERLLDRIRLYALNEIQDCLAEKESLVLMNFNLVALKESQTVEKLTRTTILLAKATIIFLPVSLMTAYFSVQIPDIQITYTLKTYWLCFLVVALASILMLFVFGIANDKVEGRTVYRSLTQIVWDKGKKKRH